jgi:hypothetical protein
MWEWPIRRIGEVDTGADKAADVSQKKYSRFAYFCWGFKDL